MDVRVRFPNVTNLFLSSLHVHRHRCVLSHTSPTIHRMASATSLPTTGDGTLTWVVMQLLAVRSGILCRALLFEMFTRHR